MNLHKYWMINCAQIKWSRKVLQALDIIRCVIRCLRCLKVCSWFIGFIQLVLFFCFYTYQTLSMWLHCYIMIHFFLIYNNSRWQFHDFCCFLPHNCLLMPYYLENLVDSITFRRFEKQRVGFVVFYSISLVTSRFTTILSVCLWSVIHTNNTIVTLDTKIRRRIY